MATTMNISGYEVEREAETTDDYGEAAKCAEWNPQLSQVSELPAGSNRHTDFPPELAHVDIEAFLEKMNKYQP
ncbi:MAG: hypothetical protein Q7U91_12660 [Sideroxyarcus sp.]|nr:hypothetical protein [Sideroxyarcus sp.]